MLTNDTATIAVEVPVYLKLRNNTITGHIDILQTRYKKIHILNFKPENINKQEAIMQLYHYALALSKITNIQLNQFQCAFFNNNSYHEFSPNCQEPPITDGWNVAVIYCIKVVLEHAQKFSIIQNGFAFSHQFKTGGKFLKFYQKKATNT